LGATKATSRPEGISQVILSQSLWLLQSLKGCVDGSAHQWRVNTTADHIID
jgi:hypothetical protein